MKGLDSTIAFDEIGHSEEAIELLQKFRIGRVVGQVSIKPKEKPIVTAIRKSDSTKKESYGYIHLFILPILIFVDRLFIIGCFLKNRLIYLLIPLFAFAVYYYLK